jgi:acyl-coenzyme A thioesterase PaaI-like protein
MMQMEAVVNQKEKIFQINPLWKFLKDTHGMEAAFECFGPYRGASISPKIIDRHTVEVLMPLVIDNTNYVGTHFGGSLYSMCDPFFMYIMMENLGENVIVWDKSARIDFIKPGKGTVRALFHIPPEEIDHVKGILETAGKTIRDYYVEIKGEDGEIVAKVYKQLYMRNM